MNLFILWNENQIVLIFIVNCVFSAVARTLIYIPGGLYQAEESRIRINLALSAFSRLKPCFRSRCTKSWIYQVMVRSIPLNGCETWPARLAAEMMMNDSIGRILHVRRPRLTNKPEQLAHRSLRYEKPCWKTSRW